MCMFSRTDSLWYMRAKSVFLLTSNILLVPSEFKEKILWLISWDKPERKVRKSSSGVKCDLN